MPLNIDIGSSAIDRALYFESANATLIVKGNPANYSGKITKVYIYAHSAMYGVEIATFVQGAANIFSTRDTATIGTISAGYSEHTVNLTVKVGDFLGMHYTSGEIELTGTGQGEVGVWKYNADQIPCTDVTFEFVADCTISLYGTGAPIPPTVTTQAVTTINETTATGNGNITDIGSYNATKRGVCWNTTGSPTVANSKSEELGSFTTGAFTRPITGLIRGERYYVKAYAYNSGGYSYGAEVNFYTKPAVTTYAPTNIIRADPTTVTANALIDLDVAENITTRGFKYGLTEADTWNESETGTYSEGAFSLTLTGLTADTTYFIRAYAVGAWGTKYGSYLEFKTTFPYGSNKTEMKSEAIASDADIDLVGGKRSLTISNHLIQTQTIANIISAAYLADYKDQKTKLRVTKPTPPPYEIGDTIFRRGDAEIPYADVNFAVISYAAAADGLYYYNLTGVNMLIRKLNVSFSAGDYISIIELEN